MLKKFSMPKILMSLGAMLCLSLPAQAAPEIGQAAPAFEGVNILSGETIKLADLKGKTVVLEWTNKDCPYVEKHYGGGNMQKIQKQAKDEYGVEWISIVSSAEGKQGFQTPEDAKKHVADVKAEPNAKILDPAGTIGKLYDAQTTPHMFIINAEGNLVYKGAIDSDSSPRPEAIDGATNYVLAALSDLKAGADVKTPSTQPYGCSVKY